MAVPYISRKDVEAALHSLIYTTREPDTDALSQLLLVDLRVSAPTMPASDEARRLALRELLAEEISTALSEQRAFFGLDRADDRESVDQALELIAGDRDAGAALLLAWSLLYYRYVRADLDFAVEALARAYGIETRTITRYGNYGTRVLTHRLIQRERAARRDQKLRRLLTALPYSTALPLIGREQLLDDLEQRLRNLSPCHVLVTGVSGIGKTSLVQELLRRFIERDQLDQLIWIEAPPSMQFVRERLAETLLHEGGAVNLREYLLIYRVAVVIDEAGGLELSAGDWEGLLRDLGAAVVVFITPVLTRMIPFALRVTLPEIDAAAADQLMVDLLRSDPTVELDPHDLEAIAHDLAGRVGGNPLALRLAATQWDRPDWEAISQTVQTDLFDRVFDALNSGQQRLWGALALFSHPIQRLELLALWQFDRAEVDALIQQHVIETNGAELTLVGAARAYIKAHYASSPVVHALLDALIDEMKTGAAALEVIEQVLLTGFPTISPTRRISWSRAHWQTGLQRGSWATWRAILELSAHNEAADPELRLAYGVCLRRLSDWAGAQQVFYQVVTDCGRTGQFALQASAFVEWAILAKYQGDFRQARTLLDQAKRYGQRTQASDLLERVSQQEAQLLIQQGRGTEAYQLLIALPETGQSLALQSEAQLLLENFKLCLTLANRALTLLDDDRVTEASLHTIIGRAQRRQGDLPGARRELTQVVTLLERLGELFELARAKTNLAAVLISLDERREASLLLADAEQVQMKLGDKVGLRVTRRNRDILGGYFAR